MSTRSATNIQPFPIALGKHRCIHIECLHMPYTPVTPGLTVDFADALTRCFDDGSGAILRETTTLRRSLISKPNRIVEPSRAFYISQLGITSKP